MAGDVVLQERLQRVVTAVLVLDYVMTGGAAHAVARERAVLEVFACEIGVVDPIEFEVGLGILVIRRSGIITVIGVELAFAHHPVATKARVDDRLLIRGPVFQVSKLAVELGEEISDLCRPIPSATIAIHRREKR